VCNTDILLTNDKRKVTHSDDEVSEVPRRVGPGRWKRGEFAGGGGPVVREGVQDRSGRFFRLCFLQEDALRDLQSGCVVVLRYQVEGNPVTYSGSRGARGQGRDVTCSFLIEHAIYRWRSISKRAIYGKRSEFTTFTLT